MMPLNLAPLQELQIVTEIHGQTEQLNKLGLSVGSDVTLLDRQKDALIVSVHGQPLKLQRSLAYQIMV